MWGESFAASVPRVPLPPGMGDPMGYPRFVEPVTGQYIPPGDFYRILEHIEVGPKRALVELAYFIGVRKRTVAS
jgi:hypothetical protein